MYICKICKQVFEKKGQIGYHTSTIHGNLNLINQKISKDIREEYYADPKKCLHCKKVLSYEEVRKGRKIFCSRSCAASFNNSKRDQKIIKIKKSHQDNGSKERSDVYWFPVFEKWFLGENPPEFSSRGKITEGDLQNAAKKRIKEILIEEQNHKCLLCGQEDKWNNLPLIMILDHVDGDPRNHIKKNLRLICPNCDTQLLTHGSRNNGKGRYSGRISRRQYSTLIKQQ